MQEMKNEKNNTKPLYKENKMTRRHRMGSGKEKKYWEPIYEEITGAESDRKCEELNK